MQKKHLYHFPKRMVCMALAAMMTLSTVLTGCGAESTTAHALEDDPDHTHVTEAVSDETVSLRETLADSLDDSLADQAAVISDEFWENDVPADVEAVGKEVINNEEVGDPMTVETGSSVDISQVETPLTEQDYDENGLRETDFGVEVMYTTVEKDYLTASTITGMWDNCPEAFINNSRVTQPLYEAEGYSDVYVAFIDYGALNNTEGEIISADFSRNSIYKPVDMEDNVVFDKETGVLYVPKAWCFAGDGTEVGLDLKAQVMVAVDSFDDAKTDEYGNPLVNVSVTVENNDGADTILTDGQYPMMAYDYVVLPLFEAGSVAELTSDDITVYMNEYADPVDAENLAFNSETGCLTINTFASNTTNVKVVFNEKTIMQSMASFFSVGNASALTPLNNKTFTDGMQPIFNVTTGEELNPNIDITNISVGDVFAYETNDATLNNDADTTTAMHALGQDDFVYTTDFNKMDRTESYQTITGQISDLDTDRMEYQLGYDKAWTFVIELPGDNPLKKQHSPLKIKGNGAGQVVYFGTTDDWKWINDDDPRLAEYPAITEIRRYSVYGQCSHTAGDAYLAPGFESSGDIVEPPEIHCTRPTGKTQAQINNFKCECEDCEDCLKYRQKTGRYTCDKNCPCCNTGKCAECRDEWACALYRNKTKKTYCDEGCFYCSQLFCPECAGTGWIDDAVGGQFHAGAVARVLAMGEGYMVLGLAQTDNGSSQRGSSVIKVRTSVKIQVKKESTSTLNNGTVDNPCYEDLNQSEYTVYRDEALTDPVGTIKGDGEDYVLVTIGDYWIKETKAPVGYYMDVETHAVHPTKNTCYTFTDDPMEDPIIIAAQKNVQNRPAAGTTTGDVGALSGIQFDVYYYKGEFTAINELPAAADEHAVFQTDANGLLRIDDEHIMPGETWKYLDENGAMLFPMGTIMVKEKSSIDGLLIYNPFGMLFTLTDTSDKTSNMIRPENWTDENGQLVLGYHGTITTIEGSSNKEVTEDRVGGTYENQPIRGGLTVWKADLDWEKSDFQGDATLAGAEFTIYNRSESSVWYKGTVYEKDEAIDTIVTSYDEASNAYVATTGTYTLEYGTYEVVETKAPEGYNLADWSRTFTIREDGQMHYYKQTEDADSVNGLNWMHRWCADAVMRGGVAFGKVDRETKQYYSLGASSLTGSTFDLINRSIHPVYVDGVTYNVGDVIMSFTIEEMTITHGTGTEAYEQTIIGATTGNNVLPYGTYDIVETGTGIGYLYDTDSKTQVKTFSIRGEGDMHYFTDEADAFHNQVQREDWYFQKKADDSGHEMPMVAWTVTSATTGETHVIVTDENGKYQSNQVPYRQRTNSNDPDSPISNGAIGIDEDGDYYVADSSKLDYDAGTWFTGLRPEITQWADDGLSYTVIDGTDTVTEVGDYYRAYPYDTYYVQELPSDANEGYNLVNFIVTLKRYDSDPDSNGIILDYGTVDDQHVDIYTHLGYTATKFSNIVKYVPTGEEVEITDVITYSGLTAGGTYTMKGEIHATDESGEDLGVIATNEIEFEAKASGQLKMPFTVDTTDRYGQILVATEEIYQDGTLLTGEYDLDNIDQSVIVKDMPNNGTEEPDVEIDTYAVNADTNGKELSAAADQSIYECIKLSYMQSDVSYKLEGSVYWIDDDGMARAILDADGNPVTAVIENPESTEVMVFDGIDASELGGRDIVVYQIMYERATEEEEWKVAAEHCDNTDEDQMVHVPKIDTELVAENGVHNTQAGDKVILTDRVDYSNVTIGQTYTLTGTLHIRDDAEVEDGYEAVDMGEIESVVAEAEFTAEAEEGSVDVVFTYDASDLDGKVVVAFEEMYTDAEGVVPEEWAEFFNNAEIMTLADEADDTEADDTEADDSEADDTEADDTEADDTEADDTEADDTEADDEVNTPVAGASRLVASHKDIADTAQSVGFMNIKGTTLTAADDTHVTMIGNEVILTDVVEYEGAVPGLTYDIIGTLNVRGEEGDALVTVEDNFTPATVNGTTTVTFALDATELSGKTVVAFETISTKLDDEVIELASHKDIDDENQSVHFAGLDTVLTATRETFKITDTEETTGKEAKDIFFEVYSGYVDKVGESNLQVATVEFKDVVSYSNLTPGKEYTLKSELHMRVGAAVDGGRVSDVNEMKFTPEAESGTVEVMVKHAPVGIEIADLVMFEYLYDGDKLVATHEDITDEDQTVTVTASKLDPNENPENPKNPCGCDDPDCAHKNEKDHCVNNPGCCDDSDCCKNCTTCKHKNPCGCDDPDCAHKNEKDHCKKPGCCDDSYCCKDCTDCKHKNPCGCDDPDCKHKNEKDHCKKPGCCDDSDCCKDCTDCKHKNPCGCDDPNCKHKNEKDHCVNNPGCCDDSSCCKNCTQCKSAKNPCGCDDPNCKHKNEKDHCKNNPGCCDDADCCKNCKQCKSKPAATPSKNACGCDDPNCKHKDEKNHCKNNPGCCDDADCCKDCKTCKSKPATTTTTKKPSNNPIKNAVEAVKTGENTFLLASVIGLVLLSGGGYIFFGRTDKGRKMFKKIREKLAELFGKS